MMVEAGSGGKADKKETDSKNKAYKVFKLNVIPNEELVQQLLVYADQVEVLEPLTLREKLRKRAEAIVKNNENHNENDKK